jgi:peptide-methionine (R)-S-oxide reductase
MLKSILLCLSFAAVVGGMVYSVEAQGNSGKAAVAKASASSAKKDVPAMSDKSTTNSQSLPKTNEEWATCLTPEQFRILREKGTERAFTGPYWDNKRPGRYYCAGCNTLLFDSTHKFDSGTGWPSFTYPATSGALDLVEDRSHGMIRTEVVCRTCKGHLGHVFPDGPPPTGLRFCINGHALKFVEAEDKTSK